MDNNEFKDFAKAMTDYIVEYLKNIRDRPVTPSVEPGYLRPLLPPQAPTQPESWKAVMADIERIVMSGTVHWHSPRFHAFFPSGSSFPSILADMLSGAIACVGLSWVASPACTELEIIMLDWLGQMIGLPDQFLSRSGGEGGGVIQGSASEATLIALLGAKARTMHRVRQQHPDWTDTDILAKLVGYCNKQANSSVERAGLLSGVKLRGLKPDDKRRLRGDILRKAIEEDISNGLIPFYVVVTLGTTSSCTFDDLDEIGDVCSSYDVWIHVDAAYAGSAFICPEYRYLMKGVEKADSINVSPHKWLLVNFDCAAMWLKQPRWIIDAFKVNPIYLRDDQYRAALDYRHWQIPLGRRFRALKLWFVLRLYGIENLQKHIRKYIALAHFFENLCISDHRFELFEEVVMGLVCFRLKGDNEINEKLVECIKFRGNIHLSPGIIDDIYFLRLAICSRFTEESDIQASWQEIVICADKVVNK